MQSNIVHSVKCNDGDHRYIEKSDRKAVRRKHKCGAPKNPFDESKSSVDVDVVVGVSVDISRKTDSVVKRLPSRNQNKTATTDSNSNDTSTTITSTSKNNSDKRIIVIN
jgi:hypothetical protein